MRAVGNIGYFTGHFCTMDDRLSRREPSDRAAADVVAASDVGKGLADFDE
jgi:hypothetical protein